MESKIEATLKAVHHILVSSDYIQAQGFQHEFQRFNLHRLTLRQCVSTQDEFESIVCKQFSKF